MFSKPMRFLLIMAVFISCICLTGLSKSKVKKGISFTDDFEKGAVKWDFVSPERIKILDSGDAKHGNVLSLQPGGPSVYALIKDSHDWTNIRVEADFYFPIAYHHYLGFMYNYRITGTRADFGCIYVYGPFGDEPGSFLRRFRTYGERPPSGFIGNILLVNPHLDSNATRSLYSEYWVALKGDQAVKPREWHHLKAEVVGPVCHFYIDDMKTPKITFDYFQFSSGRVGFKPRFSGSVTWIDNIKVTAIKELSYKGPTLPEGINHKPGKLLTKWDVIGPFGKRIKEIEDDGYLPEKSYVYHNKTYKWKPFKADPRGCVISGWVVDMFSGKSRVYFHTEISSDSKKNAVLEIDSTNNLTIWVNNAVAGRIKARFLAWHDFWEDPNYPAQKINITLNPGKNHLVVMDIGGKYGGDGFFAYFNDEINKKASGNEGK